MKKETIKPSEIGEILAVMHLNVLEYLVRCAEAAENLEEFKSYLYSERAIIARLIGENRGKPTEIPEKFLIELDKFIEEME